MLAHTGTQRLLSNLPVGTAKGTLVAYKPGGCAACDQKGYKGRLGVFELLVVTDEIRHLILKRAAAVELARVAVQQGMITMLQDATAKVLQGITSMEEALRVVDTQ